MSMKEKISMAWKNIKFQKKKNIIYIIVLTLLFLLIFLLLIFLFTYHKGVLSVFEQDRNLRVLSVSYDTTQKNFEEIKPILQSIPHVTRVISWDDLKIAATFDFGQKQVIDDLYGVDASLAPKIISGRYIKENEKEMICPNHIFINSDNSQLFRSDYVDASLFLNQEMKIYYKKYSSASLNPILQEETYKIVGLYDTKTSIQTGYQCFTSFENINEMNNQSSQKNDDQRMPLIILDSADNYKTMDAQFTELRQKLGFGIQYHPLTQIDAEYQNVMNKINSVITIFIVFLTILFTGIIIIWQIKSLKERKEEIGLLKSLGYRNKTINTIFLIEQTMRILIAYLITWIVIGILKGVYGYFQFYVFYSLQSICIIIPFSYLILVLGIWLFIAFLVNISMFHKIKNTIPQALQK